MDLLLLRLIHILAGIYWVGSAFAFFLFVQPAVLATAPEGQRFMLHLLRNRRYTEVGLGAAILAVAAGAILFWRDSNGLQLAWMSRPPGLGFTVGAVTGLIALTLFLIAYPNGRRLVDIGSRLEAERRPPTDDEQRTLASAQQTVRRAGLTILVLLALAAASMSTARYWGLVL